MTINAERLRLAILTDSLYDLDANCLLLYASELQANYKGVYHNVKGRFLTTDVVKYQQAVTLALKITEEDFAFGKLYRRLLAVSQPNVPLWLNVDTGKYGNRRKSKDWIVNAQHKVYSKSEDNLQTVLSMLDHVNQLLRAECPDYDAAQLVDELKIRQWTGCFIREEVEILTLNRRLELPLLSSQESKRPPFKANVPAEPVAMPTVGTKLVDNKSKAPLPKEEDAPKPTEDRRMAPQPKEEAPKTAAKPRENKSKVPKGMKYNLFLKKNGPIYAPCFACARKVEYPDLVCGHIIPACYGGLAVESNLVLICSQCNGSMGTAHMFDFMLEHEYAGCKHIDPENKEYLSIVEFRRAVADVKARLQRRRALIEDDIAAAEKTLYNNKASMMARQEALGIIQGCL